MLSWGGGEHGKDKPQYRKVSQESEDVAGRPCQADEGDKGNDFCMGVGQSKSPGQPSEVACEKIELHCFGFTLTKKGKNLVSKKWWQK